MLYTSSISRHSRLASVAAAWLLLATPSPAAGATDVCELATDERVIAVGDVHGGYEPFAAILREAQIIDERERWIAGGAVLVQTGDVLDRGPDSKRAIDLLRKLEREAARAGGAVHALLGNHELMRIVGDWRYVSAGEYAAFRRSDSLERRAVIMQRTEQALAERAAAEQRSFDRSVFRAEFERDVPLGFAEMRTAFGTQGAYGAWIRSRPAVVKINGIAFVHGGISPTMAPLGCAGINEAIASELRTVRYNDASGARLANEEAGPLWYRGLASEPEGPFAPSMSAILEDFGVRGIVVGHTPEPGRVVARFGGRVVVLDTGMVGGEFYEGGAPAAVELRGTTLTSIYLGGRRETIPTPLLFAPRAARR